jgi:hypothetical protein
MSFFIVSAKHIGIQGVECAGDGMFVKCEGATAGGVLEALVRHDPDISEPATTGGHEIAAAFDELGCWGRSTVRRTIRRQRAANNHLALRVFTVAKGVESEAVRTGRAGFHQILGEVGYIADPHSPTAVRDLRPRLRSRRRERRPVTDVVVF